MRQNKVSNDGILSQLNRGNLDNGAPKSYTQVYSFGFIKFVSFTAKKAIRG